MSEASDDESFSSNRSSTLTTDDENQFLYDEEAKKLLCMGSDVDGIPSNIVEEYASKTKIVDLSGNRFRSLSSLEHFPHLEELIIDDNQLDDVETHFPKLPKLHTLIMNKNRFEDTYQLIERLRQAYPSLTYLSLLGNPACPYQIYSSSAMPSHSHDEEYRRYRHLLIYRLPTLKFLDLREISPNERRMGMQLGEILYAIAETKKRTSQKDVILNWNNKR